MLWLAWVLMLVTPLILESVDDHDYSLSDDEAGDMATETEPANDDLPIHSPSGLTPIDVANWYRGFVLPNGQDSLDVLYELTVGADGVPTDCRIRRTSGRPESDSRVCDQLLQVARFEPSAESGDVAPRDYASRFAIRRQPSDRSRGEMWTLALFIEEDGTVSRCEWVEGGPDGINSWDICSPIDWTNQRSEDGELVRGEVTLLHPKN